MDIKDSHIDDIILDYINGVIDVSSEMELTEWMEQSDENRNYFKSIRELWLASGAANNLEERFDSKKAFDKFKKGKFTAGRGKMALRISVAAVAAVLLASLSFLSGQKVLKSGFDDIKVEAPMGSMSILTLPDGSKVWLNAGSSLCYSQGFGVSDRNVKLCGEGYFEVEHDRNLPFSVKSDNLQVTVMGTKFNFRDYPNDLEVTVSLLEGRVAMTNLLRNEDDKYLNPGQRAVLSKYNGKMTIESRNTSNAAQWTNGTLFIDEEPLSDIVKELERSYNVSITLVGEDVKRMRVYGCFRPGENSIEQVLDILSSTNNISYTINGDEIVIRGATK